MLQGIWKVREVPSEAMNWWFSTLIIRGVDFWWTGLWQIHCQWIDFCCMRLIQHLELEGVNIGLVLQSPNQWPRILFYCNLQYCWSWNSNTLATSWERLTHWKRPWCWERLGAGGEGDDRGWDDWMASLIRWTSVWVNSGSWWWTGRPGVLRFMGLQRVRHDWATELNWTVKNTHLHFTVWPHTTHTPPRFTLLLPQAMYSGIFYYISFFSKLVTTQ